MSCTRATGLEGADGLGHRFLGKLGRGCRGHGGDGSVVSQGADERFADRLTRARDGGSSAFDELVRWLERPLVGFLRARGADDGEGLANEVLVRVFRGIARFEGGEAQFRAWVFRIARNALIDERRHRGRRPDMVPTVHNELPEPAALDDFPDRIGERERVEGMLSGLTDEQREVVLLRVVAGLSVDETARVVGRRPGAVKALQHRAMGRVRASLARRP
jgi:RNA polymerase sigma factor (sigma-70 family)